MKLLKSSVAAVALALACSAHAEDNTPDVYGKINVSVQNSDDGDGSFTEVKSNASRFGIKGDYTLNDDLTAVYKVEFQVDVSDNGSDNNIKARNQYVGLKGFWGEVLVGRNDSMLKQSQGKLDLFNDYEGDIKSLWKGENRLDQSISYMSPAFNDFKVGMSFAAEGDTDSDNGVSLAAFYGDANLKKSQYFASVAYDSKIKGYDVIRASAHAKFGDVKIGAAYHDQKLSDSINGDDKDKSGFLFNTSYTVVKNLDLKAQYQELEDDNVISAGADYKLGAKTKLFAWYTTRDWDAAEDQDYLAIGIEHKF